MIHAFQNGGPNALTCQKQPAVVEPEQNLLAGENAMEGMVVFVAIKAGSNEKV